MVKTSSGRCAAPRVAQGVSRVDKTERSRPSGREAIRVADASGAECGGDVTVPGGERRDCHTHVQPVSSPGAPRHEAGRDQALHSHRHRLLHSPTVPCRAVPCRGVGAAQQTEGDDHALCTAEAGRVGR